MAAVGGDKRTSRADLVAAGLVVLLALWVFAPFFRDTRTMGFQDWDEQAAFRYVSVLALRDYGQWPFWNAWYCGGFPAWGYVESATNVVSPFAPFYFAFAYPLAARLEAVAATVVGVLACYLLAGRYTRSRSRRATCGTSPTPGCRSPSTSSIAPPTSAASAGPPPPARRWRS